MTEIKKIKKNLRGIQNCYSYNNQKCQKNELKRTIFSRQKWKNEHTFSDFHSDP